MVRRLISVLQHRVLRASLPLGRRAELRAEGKDLGLMLSPERRDGAVALIWALGTPPDEVLQTRLYHTLRTFDTVIFVTDGLAVTRLIDAEWLFEAIPGPALRCAAPARDWARYLERRIERIRRSWQPDFEAVLGETPEAFVEAAAGPSPQATAAAGR
jgi:hypothetical protein